MVEIVKIDTGNKADVRRFIQVNVSLYKGCPYWVPPLPGDQEFYLDRRRNPFFEHSDADFFIAVKDGRDVGRIAVLENRRHNEHKHEHTAYWYFFDSIDDLEVSRALFQAAEDWARARGLNQMLGPKGFIPFDAFGVLIQGFDALPAMGGLYNYPYYDKLVTDMGYQRFVDITSWYMDAETMDVSPRIYELAEKVKKHRGITIKTFRSKNEIRQMANAIMQVYNDTFVNNWEYVPVTQSEMKAILDRMLPIVRPELIKLAMKGDEIIGFLFGFPNINEAIQQIGGRLWPFGFIKLLRALKTTRRIDLNGMGILPKHQGGGANAVLYAEMARTIKDNKFRFAELVQVEAGNEKMQAEVKALGAILYKIHRVYTKRLD
jgi:GNAT superfamily N-acetyltransferase